MPGGDGVLKARDFVFYCEELTMAALAGGFPPPERRMMWTILQLYYGDPSVHFELQPQVGRRVVEVGLHFEGAPEANDAWARLIASHAPEITARLGPEWELEEWTPSWRRLHRTFRFHRLDRELAREVAQHFAAALQALQPIVAAGLDGQARLEQPPQRGGSPRPR